MRVGELTPGALAGALAVGRLSVRAGPFALRMGSDVPGLAGLLADLYRDVEVLGEEPVHDFHVWLRRSGGVRRLLRPQARFVCDGGEPFLPLPLPLALPMLEWGINFLIATRAHQYLMLHAAVVARGERALILPGVPGQGKSTLCAALVCRGWRLLSDEFALVDPATGALQPLPRLVALKNASIPALARFEPAARIGPSFSGTRKGTVAHFVPPRESIEAADRPARATWLVVPRFVPAGETGTRAVDAAGRFLALASNAFNYETRGHAAFRWATGTATRCPGAEIRYHDLDEGVRRVEAFCDGHG